MICWCKYVPYIACDTLHANMLPKLAALYGPAHWVGAEKPPRPQQLELVILSSSKVRTKSCIPASHSRTASSFSPQKLHCSSFCSEAGRRRRGTTCCLPCSLRARPGPSGSAGLSSGPGVDLVPWACGSGPPEGGLSVLRFPRASERGS